MILLYFNQSPVESSVSIYIIDLCMYKPNIYKHVNDVTTCVCVRNRLSLISRYSLN